MLHLWNGWRYYNGNAVSYREMSLARELGGLACVARVGLVGFAATHAILLPLNPQSNKELIQIYGT